MEIYIGDGENLENWIAMRIGRVNFLDDAMKFDAFHTGFSYGNAFCHAFVTIKMWTIEKLEVI